MDIRPNRHNLDSNNNDNGSDMKTIGNIIVATGLVFFAVLVLKQVQAPKPDQEATPVDLKSKKTSPSTLG